MSHKISPVGAVYPSKIFFTGWCRQAAFQPAKHSHSAESGGGDSQTPASSDGVRRRRRDDFAPASTTRRLSQCCAHHWRRL